jgi:hypothetical protein
LCLGTNASNGNVDVRAVSSKTQLVVGAAYDVATPHFAEMDNTTTGLSISDGTNGFTWSGSGVAKWVMNTTGGRNYLCAGPWNTDKVPCFTTADGGTDLVMYESDGSAWTGTLNMGGGTIYLKAGTAASPGLVFDNGNTGLYRVAADELGLSIDGALAGSLAFSLSSVVQAFKPAAGYYFNLSDVSGDPASGDCNANAETGRLTYDYTGHRFAVCNEQSSTRSGWDYAALTD